MHHGITSTNPLKNGVITQISIYLSKGTDSVYGITIDPDLSVLARNWIGSYKNSWGLSISNGCFHNMMTNNGPPECLFYEKFESGDIMTIRIDLTHGGTLEYFKNERYLGMMTSGFKKYGK